MCYNVIDCNDDKNFEYFTKNNCKKKLKRGKVINYISNGRTMIILVTVGLIKKILLYKISYFPELQTRRKK